MPVSHTRTRLKGFVTLRTVPGGAFMPDAASIVQNLNSLSIVGAAQRLYINQERDSNNQRWEFQPDPTATMTPAETYPGKSKFSLTLHRTELYDSNLPEAFGVDSAIITEQFKPLVLVVEQPVPEDPDGNPLVVDGTAFKRRTYIIPGCWFNNLPIQYEINESDLKFVAEVEMICQNVISFPG